MASVQNDLDWKKGVCVFCGSSVGTSEEYLKASKQVGAAIARSGGPLVYGGGSVGLMGSTATATLDSGGKVWGVIPAALLAHERALLPGTRPDLANPTQVDSSGKILKEGDGEAGNSRVTVVASMHERKQLMAKLAEKGFVILPGGFGTFEETLEMVTWSQLGIHHKPVIVLSINSFFSSLKQFISSAVQNGFIKPANEKLLVFVEGPSSGAESAGFDWGESALKALDEWYAVEGGMGVDNPSDSNGTNRDPSSWQQPNTQGTPTSRRGKTGCNANKMAFNNIFVRTKKK